jgi:hypothetical protein
MARRSAGHPGGIGTGLEMEVSTWMTTSVLFDHLDGPHSQAMTTKFVATAVGK